MYAVMGALSSMTIFIERAERRPETAMFVATRAIEVAWALLKEWAPEVRVRGADKADVVGVAGGVAALMHVHRRAPHLLSPVVNAVIGAFTR
jgi:hypothetical protein